MKVGIIQMNLIEFEQYVRGKKQEIRNVLQSIVIPMIECAYIDCRECPANIGRLEITCLASCCKDIKYEN